MKKRGEIIAPLIYVPLR